MSTYQLTTNAPPSKLVLFDSRDGYYLKSKPNGDPYHTDIAFDFPDLINIPEHVDTLISVHSASIPFSFYLIRQYVNDVIAFIYTDKNGVSRPVRPCYIPEGNYSLDATGEGKGTPLNVVIQEQLAVAALEAGMPNALVGTIEVGYDAVSNKLDFGFDATGVSLWQNRVDPVGMMLYVEVQCGQFAPTLGPHTVANPVIPDSAGCSIMRYSQYYMAFWFKQWVGVDGMGGPDNRWAAVQGATRPEQGSLIYPSSITKGHWVYRVGINFANFTGDLTDMEAVAKYMSSAMAESKPGPRDITGTDTGHYLFKVDLNVAGEGLPESLYRAETYYAPVLPVCQYDSESKQFIWESCWNFNFACYDQTSAKELGLIPGEEIAELFNLKVNKTGESSLLNDSSEVTGNPNNLIDSYGYFVPPGGLIQMPPGTPVKPPPTNTCFRLTATPPAPPPPPPPPPDPTYEGNSITIINSADLLVNGWAWRMMREEIGMTAANFAFDVPLVGKPQKHRTPNCVDLRAGLHSLHLRSSLTTTAAIDSMTNNYSSVLCRLPVNDVLPGQVIYANHSGHQSLVKTKSVKHVILSLCDDRNRLIDLNGLHWQVAITFHFVYAKKAIPELGKQERRLITSVHDRGLLKESQRRSRLRIKNGRSGIDKK